MLVTERRNAAPSALRRSSASEKFQKLTVRAIDRSRARSQRFFPCNFFATLSSETRFLAISRDVSTRQNTRRASCCAP